jgi:hypothetical protein
MTIDFQLHPTIIPGMSSLHEQLNEQFDDEDDEGRLGAAYDNQQQFYSHQDIDGMIIYRMSQNDNALGENMQIFR